MQDGVLNKEGFWSISVGRNILMTIGQYVSE